MFFSYCWSRSFFMMFFSYWLRNRGSSLFNMCYFRSSFSFRSFHYSFWLRYHRSYFFMFFFHYWSMSFSCCWLRFFFSVSRFCHSRSNFWLRSYRSFFMFFFHYWSMSFFSLRNHSFSSINTTCKFRSVIYRNIRLRSFKCRLNWRSCRSWLCRNCSCRLTCNCFCFNFTLSRNVNMKFSTFFFKDLDD